MSPVFRKLVYYQVKTTEELHEHKVIVSKQTDCKAVTGNCFHLMYFSV